ncbi:NADAR family protein [Actinomycetospora soli]|uniref:NADAR family protein n=1 Tax=Actinomycetospora soli TaxID=2893887 RepID=UPI001E30B3F6|nr:NADAR family protein [Actinomycetospora soli]MCD2190576.1 NADAR family protein [Actinomycetospora soli]
MTDSPIVLLGAVDDFRGPYWTLSNFSEHPREIDGHRYATVEHYFQAMKAVAPEDHDRIRDAATPAEAKELGRAVAMVPDWRDRRVAVMRRALAAKFTADSEAGRFLLATGEANLVEGNDWGDQLWGVSDGRGLNLLGVLLMERRGVLRL